jgi:membrane protein DedA with SNARE-associated domain
MTKQGKSVIAVVLAAAVLGAGIGYNVGYGVGYRVAVSDWKAFFKEEEKKP